MRTVCGNEFQTEGAEDRKARLVEKSVLMNGLSSSGMADERKVRLQARSAIRRCRKTGVDVLRTLHVSTVTGQEHEFNSIQFKNVYLKNQNTNIKKI